MKESRIEICPRTLLPIGVDDASQGMRSIVVLQARTNSSRLPGKVMLPIKGIPVAVLAAKRAGSTGRTVVVVTSLEASDDGLVALLQIHGIRYFRGSLENPLDRIVKALAEYDDRTVVFRLTADNVFPDGLLLDALECEFLDRGVEYLCCNGEGSGLPYGMSAEITKLGHLREASEFGTFAGDQEHVTPYVIRKYGAIFFEKYKNIKKGHYRCTIDCLDDYINIQRIFSNVDDPIRESCFDLVHRLEGASFSPIAESLTPKLVFGTAQLGSNYGVANVSGQPNPLLCQELIKTAITNGVIYFDTANAYGNSEAVIGAALWDGWTGRAKIITKLSPLLNCPQNMCGALLDAFVDASIYKSCAELRVQKLDVLMLHRAWHVTGWSGGVWQRLQKHKAAGLIDELGVSVQSPDECVDVIENPEIRYIQIPFNLLDWRWDGIIPLISAAKAQRKLTIHVRSTLLQGLLPSADDSLWVRANFDSSSPVKEWLVNQVRHCRRKGVADLCISYVNAMKWVDGIVVGMESMAQLCENISLFQNRPLTELQIEMIHLSRPRVTLESLNPVFWKKSIG